MRRGRSTRPRLDGRRESWRAREFPRGGAALVALAPTNTKLVCVVTERLEVWRSGDGGLNWQRAG